VITDAPFRTSIRKGYDARDVARVTAIVIFAMGAAKLEAFAIERMLREGIKTSFILIKNQLWRNQLWRNVFAMI